MNAETKIKSFKELEEQDIVASTELVDSLLSYAIGGWAISGRVVLGIMSRTRLETDDLKIIKAAAEIGAENQFRPQQLHLADAAKMAAIRNEATQYCIVGTHSSKALNLLEQQ